MRKTGRNHGPRIRSEEINVETPFPECPCWLGKTGMLILRPGRIRRITAMTGRLRVEDCRKTDKEGKVGCQGGSSKQQTTLLEACRRHLILVDRAARLLDHASASRAALTCFALPAVLCLGSLCIFIVDDFLRLDGHMDDVWMFLAELGVRDRRFII